MFHIVLWGFQLQYFLLIGLMHCSEISGHSRQIACPSDHERTRHSPCCTVLMAITSPCPSVVKL